MRQLPGARACFAGSLHKRPGCPRHRAGSLTCATDTIPLIAVAFAANLAAITQFVPFLDNWSNNSAITFAAVAGILPPVLSVLLQLLLPMIMRRIGKFQGARTKTKRCVETMDAPC